MKKLLFVLLMVFSTGVFAQHGHHSGHYGHRGGHWNNGYWIVPAIIGGIIVYEVTKPPIVVAAPQPTPIYAQPQVICVTPQVAYFNRVWAKDSIGRDVMVDQFAGCH